MTAPGLIGGVHRRPGARATPILDPSHGVAIGESRRSTREDVEEAVARARSALGGWGRSRPSERATVLRRLADLAEHHRDDLAIREAREGGRPIRRALNSDVPLAVATLRYFADQAEALSSGYGDASSSGAVFRLHPEPVGVVGAILPWNMALVLTTWNLAPALAAGCSVILKPAEEAALTAVRLGELAIEAGIPDDAIAVLPGSGEEVGAGLAEHPGVDLVAFTGSVATGRRVGESVAGRGRRTIMELGGKNPLVVLRDADIEAAARGAVLAGFGNAGQACSAGSRVLVEASVADEFLDAFITGAQELPAGPALDPSVLLGPVISAEAHERVTAHLRRALDQGATLACGGGRPADVPAGGWYLESTVLVDVPSEADCLRQEMFGPVVTLERFADVDDAIERANATSFGLTAGVWSRDRAVAQELAMALGAGTVWINCWHVYDPAAPFGGRGDSGHGCVCGPHAVHQYLAHKAVWSGGS